MHALVTIIATGEVRDAEGNLKDTVPVEMTQLVDVADDGTITPLEDPKETP
jgi:hypothetical protein